MAISSELRMGQYLGGNWEDGPRALLIYFITIFVFRQLELETSARHSETMKVGDRNWFVDVGLLNVHKVGGWESDDHEHLSVIIWQEEATRNVFISSYILYGIVF